jgi:hypothetical protein
MIKGQFMSEATSTDWSFKLDGSRPGTNFDESNLGMAFGLSVPPENHVPANSKHPNGDETCTSQGNKTLHLTVVSALGKRAVPLEFFA